MNEIFHPIATISTKTMPPYMGQYRAIFVFTIIFANFVRYIFI